MERRSSLLVPEFGFTFGSNHFSCRNIAITLVELGRTLDFLLPSIPLSAVMAEQMSVKLLRHILFEIPLVGQNVELLSTNGAFSSMKRSGWRFQYAQIRFRHVDMMPPICFEMGAWARAAVVDNRVVGEKSPLHSLTGL